MIKKFFKKITKPLAAGVRSIGRAIRRWITPDLPEKQGLKIQRQGSDIHIPVIYGNREDVKGIVVDKNVTGDRNQFLHMLVVFSMGEIQSFDKWYFNGKLSTDDSFKKGGGGTWFTIRQFLGSDTQSPVAGSGLLNRWDMVNSHYRGVAGALITFEMDEDQSIWNGEPDIAVEMRGKKCFDPRSEEISFTENPAIILLDYLKNSVYGRGLDDSEINIQSFIDIANVSDTLNNADVANSTCSLINGVYTCSSSPSSTQQFKRFTFNGLIDTERKLFDNIVEISNSFRGFFPESDGRITIDSEREGSPVYHFDDDNIVGGMTSELPDLNSRYNQVIVRFPNAENRNEYDEAVFPPSDSQLYQDWLAEDNNLSLQKTITLDNTVYKAEALQTAEIAAYASRNAEQAQFTAAFECAEVDVGDIVTITEGNRGWVNRTFRVSEIEYREDLLVDVTCIQHDNGIYPWSEVSYDEIAGGTNLGDPFNPPAPTGLQLTPNPDLAEFTGVISWNAPQTAFVRRYDIELWQGGQRIREFETIATRFDLPIFDAGDYQIRIFSVSTVGSRSQAALLNFTLATPLMPTDIDFTVGNFELEARPVLSGAGLGTTFEYAIETTDLVRGRGASIVFTGLSSNTTYTVFARTVNAIGRSGWFSKEVTTTADGSNIIDLIGEDIGASIFDDVVTEIQGELETTVQNALGDYPTNQQVQQIVDDNIALVNEANPEDPRIELVDSILGVVDDFDNRAQIRRVDFTIAQEGNIRAVAIQELQAGQDANLITLQQVSTDLAGTSQALNLVQGAVNNPSTGLSASFTLAQSADTKADGNASAITGLQTQVNNLDGDLSQAELILQSTVDDVGNLNSRAFLGVTTVTGGRAVINGIVVDGATNTLEFRADTLRWTDTAGNVQMYWDAGRGKVVFNGDMVAGTFQTATSGYRAEMSGTGSFPFWYGTNSKTLANARFAVDTSGNITMRNANIQGQLVTGTGTASRVEITPTGTYRIWIGEGSKTDVNGLFWIKGNGQGFISGDFFQGQIIETKAASGTSSATITNHNSAGKSVKIDSSANFSGLATGNWSGILFSLNVSIRRGTTTLGTFVVSGVGGLHDTVNNRTPVNLSGSSFVVDTITSTGNRNYNSQVSLDFPAASFSPAPTQSVFITTFENKLE